MQDGNFRDVDDWPPPLDGEEPEEMKDAEEEAAGGPSEEGSEETESESPPPAEAPVARKTRQLLPPPRPSFPRAPHHRVAEAIPPRHGSCLPAIISSRLAPSSTIQKLK